MSNVAERFGVPKKEVSCMSCGKIYGHHRTEVCIHCVTCTTCCRREFIRQHRTVPSDEFVKKIFGK
jgi:hypothetical protein